MFGNVILIVLKDLAPAIRELVKGIRTGDELRRKRALVRLENEAEELAMRKARGL